MDGILGEMISGFLKDILKAGPSLWRLIGSYNVPVGENTVDDDFDDNLVGAFLTIAPIQFFLPGLLAGTAKSPTTGLTTAMISIIVLVILVGFLSNVFPGKNSEERQANYQGWIAAIFTFWLVTTVLIIASLMSAKAFNTDGSKGDLIFLLFSIRENFSGNWETMVCLIFYSILGAIIIYLFARFRTKKNGSNNSGFSDKSDRLRLLRDYVVLIIVTTALNIFNILFLTRFY